ncbi:hypothetical protein DN387_00175 [Pseudomonas sp. FBF18]|jgi:hypothetical protein|nr:hypothetical protein [Pseudomonas sp. FBF18]
MPPRTVFQQGTLFILTGPTHHLHVVMNDPVHCGELNDMSVLVVNFSTVQNGAFHDPACVLQAGCHPFITRESFVFYRGATVLRVPRLEDQIIAGHVRPDLPVGQNVYDQVRAGFDVSDLVAPKISRYLRRHGI